MIMPLGFLVRGLYKPPDQAFVPRTSKKNKQMTMEGSEVQLGWC